MHLHVQNAVSRVDHNALNFFTRTVDRRYSKPAQAQISNAGNRPDGSDNGGGKARLTGRRVAAIHHPRQRNPRTRLLDAPLTSLDLFLLGKVQVDNVDVDLFDAQTSHRL